MDVFLCFTNAFHAWSEYMFLYVYPEKFIWLHSMEKQESFQQIGPEILNMYLYVQECSQKAGCGGT